MARKKRNGDDLAHDPERQETLAVRIAAEPNEATPSYYVNFAEVSIGAHEFAISFVRVPTKFNSALVEEAKTGPLKLEPAVQVIFAPSLMPGLIRALTSVKEQYEKQRGSGALFEVKIHLGGQSVSACHAAWSYPSWDGTRRWC
jgi:hypothetical protein